MPNKTTGIQGSFFCFKEPSVPLFKEQFQREYKVWSLTFFDIRLVKELHRPYAISGEALSNPSRQKSGLREVHKLCLGWKAIFVKSKKIGNVIMKIKHFFQHVK